MKAVAIDTETTGLNPFTGARPFMVSMCDDEGNVDVFEWEVDPITRKPMPSRKDKAYIRSVCSDRRTRKVFFNAAFDILMLESIGIEVRMYGRRDRLLVDEVRFMAKLANNLLPSYALKWLSKRFLDFPDDDEEELGRQTQSARNMVRTRKLGWNTATKDKFGTQAYKADYWLLRVFENNAPEIYEEKEYDANICVDYAANDAERTMMLYKMFREAIDDLDLWDAYNREVALLEVTMDMRRHGIAFDPRRLKKLRRECGEKAEDALERMREAYGSDDFNPNSTQQKVKMFFGGRPLSLKSFKRTPTGNPSTDGEALKPYMANELVRSYFEYTSCTKAISSFFDKYNQLKTREPDGTPILHPGLDQAGTLTWRFSCSEPNLQQASNPESSRSHTKEFMTNVREVFVPRNGYEWFLVDYSQVEVILFAAIYRVETMLDAIRKGQDVHTATANRIWGSQSNVAIESTRQALLRSTKKFKNEQKLEEAAEKLCLKYDGDIIEIEKSLGQKNYRSLSKSTTFTKIYGGGAGALMSWIGCDYEEARSILISYDNAFPDMIDAMEEVKHRARIDGYVVSPFGYRLAADSYSVYKIINHQIQNAAAGLMKLGALKSHRYLKELDVGARIVLTVHDELVFETPTGALGKPELREIARLMSDHEGRFDIETPVDVERVTTRWSEKEEVKL